MLSDDAPDVRMLWHRTAKARKHYRCDRCGDEINPGDRYESLGIITDGDFTHERTHTGANHYPSGCPSIRARDLADEHAQFEKDRALFGGHA